jgi:hypothetical protein
MALPLGATWLRALVGAAAALLAAAAVRVLLGPVIRSGVQALAGGDVVVVFALILPFAFGAAASLIADLGRPEPRFGLAAITGAFLAGGVMLAAALGNYITAMGHYAIPAAAAAPIALRAAIARPPAGLRRLEYALAWTFAGAFWPVFFALTSAFLLRHYSSGGAATLVTAAVVGLNVALFGATFTLALIDADPDRPPGEAEDEDGEA